GNTREEQMKDAVQRLQAAGVEVADVRVIDHVGVSGVVVLQTPLDTGAELVNKELQDVRGFGYVEAYDPLALPGARISQFPAPPGVEETLDQMMDVNGE